MPEFKNREEYEQWKAERLQESQEKQKGQNSEKPKTDLPPSPKSTSPLSSDGLSEIGDLLSRSWELFKARVWVLLPLQILSIAFLIACIAVFIGLGALVVQLLPAYKTPIFVTSAIIGFTTGLTAMFWPITALIIAVADRSLSIKGALAAGWKKLWAFLYLFTLLGYIVAGGYLLFLIPGVIFTVWFSFSQYILATEHTGGMNALLKSKEYVKGRWFDLLIRFLVIWAISMGVGLIPFLGIILSFLSAPFTMIYAFLMYEDLKTLHPEPLDYVNTSGEKCKWLGLATLGYIVLPLIIIAIVGAACMVPLLILKGLNLQQVPTPQRFF